VSPPSKGVKECPQCGSSLRLYEVPPSRLPFLPALGVEAIFWPIFLIGMTLFAFLRDAAVIAAFIVALAVVLLVFRSTLSRRREEAIAAKGRYVCGSCHHHFEGDALRRLTDDPS
jgi:hypothetical protein